MQFPDAIRAVMANEKRRMGLSDRALAKKAEVNHSAIRKFLTTGGGVRMDTAKKLAAAMETDLWKLVREAEEMG